MKRPHGSLISHFSNLVKRHGGINLAQGIPGFPPPGPLLDILKNISQDTAYQQYPPGNGNFQLLDIIRSHYSKFLPLKYENLLVVQGATEGIFLTFFYLTTRLKKPYSVLSFDPVYESYPQLAAMFNLTFHTLDFKADLSIDFNHFEQFIKEKQVKIFLIASPGNPLGKVWSDAEIESIIILSRRYGFYIIWDAVYKDLYFDSPPANPLVHRYEKLFYINSFSKTLSITGWRIGFIIAEENRMKSIRSLHDYTGLCAPSILQAAIYRYLEQHKFGQAYIEEIREKSKISYFHLRDALLPMNFKIQDIAGGYFLWAKLPAGWQDAFQFATKLYQTVNVGVVPGENFSRCKVNYIRFNTANELPVLDKAISLIKEFLRTNSP